MLHAAQVKAARSPPDCYLPDVALAPVAKRLKILGLNLAVCIGLALLAMAGLELYLRLTLPASSNESIFEYTLLTKRYKVMKPSARVVAWGQELKTNDLGFRDSGPTVAAKRPGERRIIVLGDSFTVSAGVDFADIYTSVLERMLKPTTPEVRVVNLGVGGYNIVQYALVLQEVAMPLDPDLVLLGMFPDNDFTNETYDLNYRVASGQEPASPPQPWYERLYVSRAYLGKVEARIRRLLQPSGKPASGASGQTDAWDDNIAALQTIARITRERGIPLVIALLPATWHFEGQRELFNRVERHCKERELNCINLLERFIASKVPESKLRLNLLDAHPNETYNALVADFLAPSLASLLPPAWEP
jgi:lysophospholipase L1-like esterase